MKRILLSVMFSVGFVAPLLADNTNILSDDKDRASYAIGMSIGHNFQQQNLDINLDLVLRGMKDMQPGGAPLLTAPEMQSTLEGISAGDDGQADEGAAGAWRKPTRWPARRFWPPIKTIPA